ncbi:hypothetical protein [Sphingomonas sp.]|uniref:hypothetical protein n=1 Tax=Sphingomonas sp. TaxID=28214 RepID=UPI003341CA57
MKKVFGVIVGIIVAFLLVAASDGISSALFPLGDVDTADPSVLAAYIAEMPIAAKLIVAAGWLIAPLAGAWLALRIADWLPGGWIVAVMFLAAGLLNQVALPHPLWMQVCAVVLPLLGGWVAARIHRKPYPGEPLLG